MCRDGCHAPRAGRPCFRRRFRWPELRPAAAAAVPHCSLACYNRRFIKPGSSAVELMAAQLFHDWDGLKFPSAAPDGGDVLDVVDRPPTPLGSPAHYQRMQTDLPSFSYGHDGDGQPPAGVAETYVDVGYRFVSRNWGETVANFVDGEMALITLDPSCILVAGDARALARSLGACCCSLLRWKPSAVLVAFTDKQAYMNFGRSLLHRNMLPGSSSLRVRKLEGAIFSDYPPCFLLSRQTPDRASTVQSDLNHVVRPFQAQFRFVSVTDNLPKSAAVAVASAGRLHPSVGVVLLFSGRQQAAALACLERLRSPEGSWLSVDLPTDVRDQLGPDAPQLFRHGSASGVPSIGVATGYPLDGVRVVVYVRDDVDDGGVVGSGCDRFGAMVQFYERLLGRPPSAHTKLSPAVEYKTFSQTSRLSEFVVARYRGLNVQPSTGAHLCFLLRNVDRSALAGSCELSAGFFKLTDPDGNLVLCTCPFE